MPCQPDEEESNVGLLPPRPDPAKMVGNYGAYGGDSEYENYDGAALVLSKNGMGSGG